MSHRIKVRDVNTRATTTEMIEFISRRQISMSPFIKKAMYSPKSTIGVSDLSVAVGVGATLPDKAIALYCDLLPDAIIESEATGLIVADPRGILRGHREVLLPGVMRATALSGTPAFIVA